jgi:4-amino-4-deoxy-L-arabinose transferase-like glycosyltransferase
MLGIIALALPVLCASWRYKRYMQTLVVALAAALPWFLVWPIALYQRSPELFHEWFWTQNIGRFTSTSLIGQRNSHFYYLTQLPYFALPSLPLALWAVWRNRRSLRDNVGIQLGLVAFLVMLTVLSLSSSIRDLYALPMLLPLVLVASAGVGSLPERAQKAIHWFCIGLFVLAAGALWLGWITMISGYPATLSQLLYRPQPDYVPAFHSFLFAGACLYTALWIYFVVRSPEFKLGYLINWTIGIVLTWGLLMTLWLPWFESGSSYRSLFASLSQKMPAGCTSVRPWGLGESERALLEYYTGLLLRTAEQPITSGCDLLLVQSGSTRTLPSLGPEWKVIWEQSRPIKPEKRPKEIFTLLQKVEGKKNQRPQP